MDLLEIDDTSYDEFDIGALRHGTEKNRQVEQDKDDLILAVVGYDDIDGR